MSFKQIVGVSVVCITGFLYLIYHQQEKILYLNETVPPKRTSENPQPFANPKQQGMDYKEIWLTTADNIKLHAWWIPYNHEIDPQSMHKPIDIQNMMANIVMNNNKNEEKSSFKTESEEETKEETVPTLIFFHANAGSFVCIKILIKNHFHSYIYLKDMGFRLPNLRALYDRLKVNLFIFSYRGYGESEGIPNEAGIMLDAECAFNYVYNEIPDVNKNRIFLFGRSLGGAVAIYTASMFNDKIAGLIIENTFSSISEMVGRVFPFLNFEIVKKYMLKIHWRSCDRIPSLTMPMVFFAGDSDEIVPHEHMLKLFSMANEAKEKELMIIAGGMHNDSWMKGGYEYWERFRVFVEKHESSLSCSVEQNRDNSKI